MHAPEPSRSREAGFSLPELLVAMVITLIVAGGALTAFTHAMRTSEVAQLKLELHDQERIALDLLVRDFIQVGQGLPTGKVIPVPSGPGSTPVNRASPPGMAYTFGVGTTELPAVTPGFTMGPVVTGQPSDIVTMIYADNQYDQADCVVSADGSTMTVAAATPIAGVPDPIRVGDIIMFTTPLGSAMQMVTRLNTPPDQTVYFDLNDPMNLNQRGAAAGTILQLNPNPGTPFNATMTRLRMVTYYIDARLPDQPRLVRELNYDANRAQAGRVVAIGIEDLQFTYDLVDGVTNPSGVPNPATPNQIRKANITISARSRGRFSMSQEFFRTSLTTQVSLRSLALVDRYQ